ncbi:toprim domain-containing protein [Adhaeribacter arboris]|nr:toprim domain-containing protein [Adhaeribacter arboris]
MNPQKPDLTDIKALSIVKILSSINIFPQFKSGGEQYYISPIRNPEKTPSFTVNERKNCWFDHGFEGGGVGGDVIDLVSRLYEIEFPVAVEFLQQAIHNPALLGSKLTKVAAVAPAEREYKSTLTLLQAGPVEHAILLKYLRSRAINLDLLSGCSDLLHQVYYQLAGKNKIYYGLGFKNNAGGYEVRTYNFQSFIGSKKDVTFLKGSWPGLAVFEGFMDYLSALTYWKTTSLKYDILILNSTRMLKAALPIILSQPHVYSFLDNDQSGLQATEFIKEKCQENEIGFTNHSEIYKGYKDFNDLLTNSAPPRPLPGTSKDTVSEISKNSKWWLWVIFREMQFTKDGVGFTKFTWFSFNSDASGYQALLQFRQSLESKIKYYRLCERTKGRDFKILEEGHV